METLLATPQESTTPLSDRQDVATRRRLSAPALRSFFQLAQSWQLNREQQRALLGWPARSTFYKWRESPDSTLLSFDQLTRVSLVLGIYKALQVLYPSESLADRWITLPNDNPLFGGRSAIDYLTDGDMDALYQVRRLLDARRGG